MLAEQVEFVIGVDTHAATHALAVVAAASGGVLAQAEVAAERTGYRAALRLARRRASGRRVWAIESTSAYGRGLTRFLTDCGEQVVELDRPARGGRRTPEKSDELDAVLAARTALGRAHLAIPRDAEGHREAIRVLMVAREGVVEARAKELTRLRALLVGAHGRLRERLSPLTEARLLSACRALGGAGGVAELATRDALRSLAGRVQAATREARRLLRQIGRLIQAWVPWLLAERGVGPISAAQVLLAWSHPGRVRSEAAFARLGGVAPIPASSGQVVRHRLDRGGDRQLNRALHTIVLARRKSCAATQAYLGRRQQEGKSIREAIRCLKRYLARSLFRRLEALLGA